LERRLIYSYKTNIQKVKPTFTVAEIEKPEDWQINSYIYEKNGVGFRYRSIQQQPIQSKVPDLKNRYQ